MTAIEEKDALWEVCRNFIDSHTVTCAEATAGDRIYEDAPELVEDIAKIVGYYKYPDDSL